MANKILICFLAVGLSLQLSGCSSSTKEEGQDAALQNDSQFAQEGNGDFAQQSADDPQGQIQPDDGGKVADQNAPQDLGQDLSLDGQQTKVAGKDELSLDDPAPLPENVAGADDPNKQPAPELAPPGDQASNKSPTDEALFNKSDAPKLDDGPPAADAPPAADVATAPPPPKVSAPLAKIKDAAFDKGGVNLNRVYLARADDKTLKAISEKVYGSNRAKDLKAWNPSINASNVKFGSKVYYQSSTNPDDAKMLTFYEEQGVEPKTHMTQEGDNLRKLSKSWLGSAEGWKEVWSTNAELSQDQKGALPAGLQLRYWPEEMVAGLKAGGDKVAGLQGATEIMPPAPDNQPPPNMAVNDIPPPPPVAPPNQPMVASTPDSQLNASGQIAPPPPPPPDQQVPPPPPPPPPDRPTEPKPIVKKSKPQDSLDASDPDTMMMMGLGGILVMAAAVLFVVLRKNRAKRIDLSQTQV